MLGVCVNVDNNYCKNIQRAFLIYEKIYDNLQHYQLYYTKNLSFVMKRKTMVLFYVVQLQYSQYPNQEYSGIFTYTLVNN